MMRTSYDPEADALFIWFAPQGTKSLGTEEVAPGVMLDFDAEGTVIGIEVLDVREGMKAGEKALQPVAAK
jgi:uncharacterized protein YuzE